jgi:hypothetical protein
VSTEYVVDLSLSDAELAEAIARALNERVIADARATAGLDPIDALPPYWVIPPGTDERFPDGVRIERIADPIPHNTDPAKRAYPWDDSHRAALLDGSTVAYLNTWGAANGYPGLGGQAQAMRAQLIQTLPAEYIESAPEGASAIGGVIRRKK